VSADKDTNAGVYFCGYSNSPTIVYKKFDMFIVKLDLSGGLIWQKRVGYD